MRKIPSLIDLPKPVISNPEFLEPKMKVSDNTVFYFVIGIISLGILYYVMKDKDFDKPSGEALATEEVKATNSFPDLRGMDPIKAIEMTHKVCPVLGGPTKYSVCLQYPPLNKGFVVSVCCESCVKIIQQSFNDGDGQYTIKEENKMNVLYYGLIPKQVSPLCSQQNIKLVTGMIGTQFMQG